MLQSHITPALGHAHPANCLCCSARHVGKFGRFDQYSHSCLGAGARGPVGRAAPGLHTAHAKIPCNRPATAPRQIDTVVTVSHPASVTASSPSSDSMLMIVAVCLGFYALSATISAVVGAIMQLSGRSLQFATRSVGSWGTAGILDTFDIMRLPLAYEIEEPSGSGGSSSSSSSRQSSKASVLYIPWDGPEKSYIPVNKLKVLQPGKWEAGLVAKQELLQPTKNLSIISITPRDKDSDTTMLPKGNGNNGHRGNGKGGSNGTSGA